MLTVIKSLLCDQMQARMGGLAVDINTHVINSSHSGLHGHMKDSSDIKVSFFMHRYLIFFNITMRKEQNTK